MISVSNGNHMPKATPPPVCQLPQGLVMLSPPLTHKNTHTHARTHTSPNHPQPLMSPLLFPTVSHLLHRALFCLTHTVSFCRHASPPFSPLQLVRHSNRHSDLAGILRLSCPVYFVSLWRRLDSGTALVVVKNPQRRLCRFTSAANQLFYCNRGAALMRGGLFW